MSLLLLMLVKLNDMMCVLNVQRPAASTACHSERRNREAEYSRRGRDDAEEGQVAGNHPCVCVFVPVVFTT